MSTPEVQALAVRVAKLEQALANPDPSQQEKFRKYLEANPIPPAKAFWQAKSSGVLVNEDTRPRLNFLSPLVATDNPTSSSVDVSAPPTPPAGLVGINDSTLGSDGSIDFPNIPATYKHLLCLVNARGGTGAISSLAVKVNGDTANNYGSMYFALEGTSPVTTAGAVKHAFSSDNRLLLGAMPSSGSADTSSWGGITLVILDYANTARWKTAISFWGAAQGTADTDMLAGLGFSVWSSTAAINELTFYAGSSSNLVAGSRATLYGLP